MTASLDPDALAELEREQQFLLRSLDDLDAEHGAGDLDAGDHARLSDDYTRRLAEVTRALDEQRVAFDAVDNKLSGRQRILTIVGVVIVAVLAGVLLARASGFRTPEDTLSGDIRQSSRSLLAEADTLTREGLWPEAIETYDEVLDLAPDNAEALTYRGWLTSRLGEPEAGLIDIDEAIAIDPAYPDARVFRAILLDDEQRFDEAAAELAVLDTLNPDEQILGLVQGSGLRVSVTAGQIAERFAGGAAIDLTEIDADLPIVAEAGVLLVQLDPPLAVRVFDAVLAEDPDQLTALVAQGQLLGADPQLYAVSADVAARGLASLDRAVELAPERDDVLLFRALARQVQDDPVGARADLDRIDPETFTDDLLELYNQLDAALA